MRALRIFRILYVQVLVAIALGVLVGFVWPHVGVELKPLGDGFIKLIKVLIAPVIFCTVATGIAHMSDLKSFGRIGGKAILYFEAVSTLALALGILVAEVIKPGAGFNIDPRTLDASAVAKFLAQAKADTLAGHLLNIIPDTFVGAFAGGDLLQVLLLAILTGFALARMGEAGKAAAGFLDRTIQVFFAILHIVVRAAPIGAFGAMGFTIGKYGLGALVKLGALIGTFYLTSALFVVVVLGLIAWAAGFSIFRFIAYIREELLIVLGTSSSETVLPQVMEKLERLGAPKAVVGLVVPAGYSFNLDGTNIYMTLATLFLAQATNTHLTWIQELTLLGVAMLTSKGASGVTGAGFITLAATLAVVPTIPIAALAVLIGIDRFMSECRALTNLVGNGVATLVVARWEKALDVAALKAELRRGPERAEAEVHGALDAIPAVADGGSRSG
jgi:aerobic C4-dicarboxylate transport protein